MNFLRQRLRKRVIQTGTFLLLGLVLAFPPAGLCQTNTSKQVKQAVEKSVQVRQETQKQRDQWETEKSKLVFLYEQLQQEHAALVSENHDLTAARQGQEVLNRNLLKQKEASLRIQKELLPFLTDVYKRLSTLVANDPPFLEKERVTRMKTLEKVINDHEISVAEKYRKVMEALFIEAEYGTTIEVYQDKVVMGKEEILGNIFRLGRVSLFFLSLDQQSCSVFNVAQRKWQPLSNEYLMAIRSAVEIGSKRKPVELLALPLGRLAIKGDEQ